jgi:hypothetical protein
MACGSEASQELERIQACGQDQPRISAEIREHQHMLKATPESHVVTFVPSYITFAPPRPCVH